MKVALNAMFLEPNASGGPETYLRELARALPDAVPELELEIFTTRRGAAALRADGFDRVVALPADEGQRIRRLLAELVLVPGAARRRRVDVLHSLASIGPPRTGSVAHVVTIHDVTFFRMSTFGGATTAIMKQLMTRAARGADALIAPAADGADDMAPVLGVPREKITVVPHGAGRLPDVEPASEADVRARFALGSRRVVLCVASKRPHKNQELLVRAAATLPADTVVVLAGHPEPYDLVLRDLADELSVADRVVFADYVPDAELEALWRMAACAAFPTLAEGFGIPVIEALGRGVPVACSDIAVLHEVGGDVPHYFDPHDPAAAAAAIVAAIGDAGARAAGPVRAARFSWHAAALQTYAVYERALAAR
jgi:glycosyltransferase involved in cell wall biosynthesis